jgi:hypothetical protein
MKTIELTPAKSQAPSLRLFFGGGAEAKRYKTYLQLFFEKWIDNNIARLSKNPKSGHFSVFRGP